MSAQSPPQSAKNEPSILEDASTLLMFSKGSNEGSQKSSTSSQGSQHHQHHPVQPPSQPHTQQHMLPYQAPPLSRTSTLGGMSPANPQASPGPASVALLHNDSSSFREQNGSDSVSHFANQHKTGSMAVEQPDDNGKGMVAAAALAAAATVPLPLKSHSRSSSNTNETSEWPVPDSYIVNIDSGVITCICGFDDDDGFTIQCDHCNRWQHAICYNIKDIETAPDDYLCNICYPRRLDVKRAKRKQLERLQRNRPSNGSRITASYGDDFEKHSGLRAGPSERGHEDWNSQLDMVDNGDDANDEQRRKRKRHEDSTEDTKRRKESPIYLNAKDAYSEIYLPTENYEFKDRYVKLFIDKHNDDDWVIPYNKEKFEAMPLEVRTYADTNNSKVFPGFSKLGVHVGERCNKGKLICEYLGEVDFQKNYLLDPRNHYRIWGTTKLRVLFHPHWPLYIDARLAGNVARYVRRSCNPNAELATIRMTSSNEVKFVLRATRELEEGEEIHLDWHWDLRHPIWQIIKGTATLDSLNDPDKYLLIHSIDAVLSTCDCACGSNNKDCVLLKVKKFSQALYKSVKSKMNNRYKLNEILNQYQGKKRRQPPILDRFSTETTNNKERASQVLADLNNKRFNIVESDNVGRIVRDDTVKPYKWKLMESYTLANKRPLTVSAAMPNQVTNPLEYDESKVNDLEVLPIPIVLEVPLSNINNHSSSSIKVDAALGTNALPSTSDIRPQESSSDQNSMNNEKRTGSSSSLQEMSEKKPTKKKLSFADYRKKQYK
ncbi:hypothetical protein ZYGR_0AD04750 [Zygosaccharomyces rouxii]|uniref:ZYRO0G17072p n=2 Tax=Zygosaccharomyces rouxii TaxID=4956 RepID=C5E107_ZYGRC|nr:uncharacterized protein ZYRO0G17072g [Zygosaccharomyces rouxii]KAH9202784.1 hypothetical protein LQ764DRAFT_232877 [Zygosaccharomyces rouxii]GAV51292.1 hypothetical protein ZYGR_0AD04750 [Zygosaccharomyces rouxii]CAR29791.1 ZYRO0G17072p [Zygosaccharomyces rouxii]